MFFRSLTIPFVLLILAAMSLSTTANGQNARIAPGEPHPKQLGVHVSFIRLSHGPRRFLKTNKRRRNRIRDDSPHSQQGFRFGERIRSVRRGTPAWRAGLERGDIIVATQPRNGGRYDAIRNRGSLKTAVTHSNSQLAMLVRDIRTGRNRWITVRFGSNGNESPRPFLKSQTAD